ncbi:MAG TPA: ABC transporter permease [Caulobacter sp.]|nr:ABC transporter permease [Caulobacter sp.]
MAATHAFKRYKMDRHSVTASASLSFGKKVGDAARDLAESIAHWHIWVSLAWQDTVARYRGSVIGPLWITLSMAALVGGMSLLYTQLLHIDARIYIPYLGTGIVIWGFISGTIQESTTAFDQGAAIIRQSNISMFIFVWRTIQRNIIVLGHNLIIVAIVVGVSNMWTHVLVLQLLGGAVLLILNLAWISTIFSFVGARFKDVPQLVAALLQLAFFMTPIFWRPSGISQHRYVLDFNPLYHMLELVRGPIMGEGVSALTWSFSFGFLAAGWLVAFLFYAAQRRRIVHYL